MASPSRISRTNKRTKDEPPTAGVVTRFAAQWKELPQKSKVAFALFSLALLGAAAITLGSAEIRSGYQAKRGHDSYALAFLALQTGTFTAAVFLSYTRIHLYAHRWRALTARLAIATALREATVSTYTGLVGTYNGQVDLRGAMLAEAGHLVGISADDVLRQIWLARHWETLASREPVTEQLFVNPPKRPEHRHGDQLVSDLTGVAPLPVFERKTTEPLHSRRKYLREQLNTLREERRAAWRAALKPGTTTAMFGAKELRAEVPAPGTPEKNGHVKPATDSDA